VHARSCACDCRWIHTVYCIAILAGKYHEVSKIADVLIRNKTLFVVSCAGCPLHGTKSFLMQSIHKFLEQTSPRVRLKRRHSPLSRSSRANKIVTPLYNSYRGFSLNLN
jgi:hypothetical protein